MEGTKTRLMEAQKLLKQIQVRQQEVKTQVAQAPVANPLNEDTIGWNQNTPNPYSRANDPLDAEFEQWDLEKELERLKREL
jgi:hypothetical protein